MGTSSKRKNGRILTPESKTKSQKYKQRLLKIMEQKKAINEWDKVPIEEIFAEQLSGVKLSQGWSPQCLKEPSMSENEWGVLKTTSIQPGYFLEQQNKQLPNTLKPRPHLEVKKGDILITCAGPRNRCGVACLVRKIRRKLMISGKMYRFRVLEKRAIPEFIQAFLQTQEAWKAIDKMKTGGSDSGLNLTHSRFKKLGIPLPSIQEQKATVFKIEELFSELDKGIEQLKTAQQQLKVYRQSVLKWAFEGIGKKVRLNEIAEKIQIGPFGSQLHREDYISNGIPLINPMHIQDGKIEADYSYSILKTKRDSLPNYILKEGDVIMGRRGEMARCGLVTKKEEGWFCGTGSLYVRPNKNVFPAFLYYQLRGETIKKYLEDNAAGTTMTNLNSKIVNSIPVNIPAFEEQKQIVQEIESRLSVADKLEETINNSLQQAEALRQSILKKAFEGRLVEV